MFITTILPALSDPSDAYNYQHLHVLSSLAEVKSIVLLTDIPKPESLTLHLFTSFFDVLSGSAKSSTGEQLGKNVEYNMTEILGAIVEESTSLSSEIIDVVMAQFLRADPRALHSGSAKSKRNGAQHVPENTQSTLELKDLPPAYNLAKRICEFCPEKMARHVSQYFNDVIVDASKPSTSKGTGKGRSNRRNSTDLNDSGDEESVGPTEEDLKELRKAHQLIRELWRACPAVLQNVTPQLELELSAENIQLRFLATETFGDMISGIGAAGLAPPPILNPSAYPPVTLTDSAEVQPSPNLLTKPSSPLHFPKAHPAAYTSFLRRQKDKSPTIRSVWTTAIGRILSTSAGGVGLSKHEEETLIDALAQMMADADEKVRIAAIKVIGYFSINDIIMKLGSSGNVTTSGSVLGTLAERVRDRKHAVRTEATTVLARIWGVSAGEIAAGEEKVISAVGAAPSRILDAYYANDMEINALLDHVLFEQLLPLGYPPIKPKSARNLNGSSQRLKDSQPNDENDLESIDPDKVRTERILILIRNLDERSKKVFFAMQSRQVVLAQLMTAYLQRCENYNVCALEGDVSEALLTEITGWCYGRE
jgi:sister-chromatid-cohesion protein PDS5